jgi:O-antigen/teichoic acid export membrane protein
MTQLVSFAIAGIFQLATISYCSSQLADKNFARFFFLLAISNFLTFLDFGIFWSLFLNLSKNNLEVTILMRLAIKRVLFIDALLFVSTLTIYGIDRLSDDILLLITAVLINNLFFIGLVALRALGGEIIYFLIFNSSWPLTFTILQVMHLMKIQVTSNFAIIPIIVSAVTNLLAGIFLYNSFLRKNKFKFEYQSNSDFDLQDFNRISYFSTLIQIFSIVTIYSDRLFVYSTLNSNNFIIYGICVQFSGMAVVLLQNYSSSLIGEKISGRVNNLNVEFYKIPTIVLLGVISSVLYIILMPLLLRIFFPKVEFTLVILSIFAINILLSSFAIHLNNLLWIANKLKERLFTQIIGVLSYLSIAFVFRAQMNLTVASIALLFFNISILPGLFFIWKNIHLKKQFLV